ncbi:MAG: hypothetical protein ACLFTP_12590 [Rhodosalinus sp.]|uniref:hypothetical protein n=1 Tax=Rhodosalinus sp. TaxID=2047741 RepID=UPI00397E7E91
MPSLPLAVKFALGFGLAANLAAAAGALPGGWIVLLPLGNLALLGAAGWLVWRWLADR